LLSASTIPVYLPLPVSYSSRAIVLVTLLTIQGYDMAAPIVTDWVSVTTLSVTYSTEWDSSVTSFAVVVPYYSITVNGLGVLTSSPPQHWSLADTTTIDPLTYPSSLEITSPGTTAMSTSSDPTSQSTSTSSTSGQVSVAPHHTISRGLGSGAVAGIAIATALLGATIGAIVVFLIAGRGKKYKAAPDYVVYSDREKEAPISPGTSDEPQLDQFLLDAQSDTALASDLCSINHLIQQHAEAHYNLNPVQLESSRLRQPLDDLGIERGSAPVIARLASLVLEPRTRLNAIRYVIAKTVFESTVIGGSACISMLPPTVSSLGASMPPIEDHIGNHEGKATITLILHLHRLSTKLTIKK
jgi:hypothetical protein